MMTSKMIYAAALALAGGAWAGDYTSWAKYRNITLSTSGTTVAPVARVPLLIRFDEAAQPDMFTGSTAALANGADLRFTKADGTTDLPFEVDNWTTGAGGSGAVWVRLDTVAANSATAFSLRVYWNKAGVTTASNPAATFDTASGYRAVFHLNEASGNVMDATNGYVGTATGTTGETGLVGGARGFSTANSGSADPTTANDYIAFSPPPSSALSTLSGPVTLEAWVYSSVTQNGNTSSGTKQILSHGSGSSESCWMKRTGTNPNRYAAGGDAANVNGPEVPFGEATDWSYVVAIWKDSSWTIYRQRNSDPWGIPTITGGNTTPSTTSAGAGPTASSNPWFIGAWSGDGTGGSMSRPWKGQIDEVRVSGAARDSNFIRLGFETQKTGSTAFTIGASVPPTAILPTGRAVSFQTRVSGSSILFQLPASLTEARIFVVDMQGREVWGRKAGAGIREITWDGRTRSGSRLAPGAYQVLLLDGDLKTTAESQLLIPR